MCNPGIIFGNRQIYPALHAQQREEQMCGYLDRRGKEKTIPISKPSFPVSLLRNKYLCSIACPHTYLLSMVEWGREQCLENDHHISHISWAWLERCVVVFFF